MSDILTAFDQLQSVMANARREAFGDDAPDWVGKEPGFLVLPESVRDQVAPMADEIYRAWRLELRFSPYVNRLYLMKSDTPFRDGLHR